VLVVVVLVQMVAMLAMNVVEVPFMKQGLVSALRAVNVHMPNVRRVDLNLVAIGNDGMLSRPVVVGRAFRGGVRSGVHAPIICLCEREARDMEDFAA